MTCIQTHRTPDHPSRRNWCDRTKALIVRYSITRSARQA